MKFQLLSVSLMLVASVAVASEKVTVDTIKIRPDNVTKINGVFHVDGKPVEWEKLPESTKSELLRIDSQKAATTRVNSGPSKVIPAASSLPAMSNSKVSLPSMKDSSSAPTRMNLDEVSQRPSESRRKDLKEMAKSASAKAANLGPIEMLNKTLDKLRSENDPTSVTLERDIAKYKQEVARMLEKGGDIETKKAVASKIDQMVEAFLQAKKEGRCAGKMCADIGRQIMEEARKTGDTKDLEMATRFFNTLDQKAMTGLGTLTSKFAAEVAANKKAGMSETEAVRKAGEKVDQWLKDKLGEDNYKDFCKGSGSESKSQSASTHGGGGAARPASAVEPCHPRYMTGVCGLSA